MSYFCVSILYEPEYRGKCSVVMVKVPSVLCVTGIYIFPTAKDGVSFSCMRETYFITLWKYIFLFLILFLACVLSLLSPFFHLPSFAPFLLLVQCLIEPSQMIYGIWGVPWRKRLWHSKGTDLWKLGEKYR